MQDRSRELHLSFPGSIKVRRGAEWIDPSAVIASQVPNIYELSSPLPLSAPLTFHDGYFEEH